ncbi:aspartate kinase [Neptuniibacter pectenicola]|jgi:aspartate kinase|uniref:aspartate kinase n=2 Tax=cellular organisms TaxID=131567 RepID=A0ABU9TWH2_9GAMM|nr:MAG: aspartate kinase [Neptuniibacter sp. Phe_28]|tara:strand:+ start:295 stop:1728 length:1434 start_codon:yes stop_codon:yes gene_type:complete
MTHTVEKIGGTSMSRFTEVLNNILLRKKNGSLFNRIFVVSAYSGVTDLLLEHKKTGDAGVYSCFAEAEKEDAWIDQLEKVKAKLLAINERMFTGQDLSSANTFISGRIADTERCMQNLHNLCSYGHFQLEEHLSTIREMLASIGEAHSAYNTVKLLHQNGLPARFVDLTGWKQEQSLPVDQMIEQHFKPLDPSKELLIVTGYTHCEEQLMRTFDRGYSEMTFAKIAALTNAREAVIHKEFHLSSADPKLVGEDNVVTIGMTNFDVADQLSNLGMEAIHPRAAREIRKSGIPIRIKNTFEPEHLGTVIDNNYCNPRPCVEIITGRKDAVGIEIFDQEMLGSPDHDIFISRLMKELKISIVNKEADANSITFYAVSTRKKINRVMRLIEKQYPSAEVSMHNIAIISAVGSDIKVKGILAKTISALSNADINILALHQSVRQVEMQCIVEQSDYEKGIKALHLALIEEENHGDVIRKIAV